jgi:hypothetical protein
MRRRPGYRGSCYLSQESTTEHQNCRLTTDSRVNARLPSRISLKCVLPSARSAWLPKSSILVHRRALRALAAQAKGGRYFALRELTEP